MGSVIRESLTEVNNLVLPSKSYWPLDIPINHHQLRHFITQPEPHLIYYADQERIFELNTMHKTRRLFAVLPFKARCSASGFGWLCFGGGDAQFARINLKSTSKSSDCNSTDTNSINNSADDAPPRCVASSPSSVVVIDNLGHDIINSLMICNLQPDTCTDSVSLGDIVVFATNNDRTIRIFDLRKNKEVYRLDLPFPVNHTTLSPDGKLLIAVGDYQQAYFYERVDNASSNAEDNSRYSWKTFRVVQLHSPSPTTVTAYFTTAWSPSGSLCATGSERGYVSIFDVDLLKRLPMDRCEESVVAVVKSTRSANSGLAAGAIRSLLFSPPPWDLLIWAEDRGRVCVLDLRDRAGSRQVLELIPSQNEFNFVVPNVLPSVNSTLQYSQTAQGPSQTSRNRENGASASNTVDATVNLRELEAELRRFVRSQNSLPAHSLTRTRNLNRRRTELASREAEQTPNTINDNDESLGSLALFSDDQLSSLLVSPRNPENLGGSGNSGLDAGRGERSGDTPPSIIMEAPRGVAGEFALSPLSTQSASPRSPDWRQYRTRTRQDSRRRRTDMNHDNSLRHSLTRRTFTSDFGPQFGEQGNLDTTVSTSASLTGQMPLDRLSQIGNMGVAGAAAYAVPFATELTAYDSGSSINSAGGSGGNGTSDNIRFFPVRAIQVINYGNSNSRSLRRDRLRSILANAGLESERSSTNVARRGENGSGTLGMGLTATDSDTDTGLRVSTTLGGNSNLSRTRRSALSENQVNGGERDIDSSENLAAAFDIPNAQNQLLREWRSQHDNIQTARNNLRDRSLRLGTDSSGSGEANTINETGRVDSFQSTSGNDYNPIDAGISGSSATAAMVSTLDIDQNSSTSGAPSTRTSILTTTFPVSTTTAPVTAAAELASQTRSRRRLIPRNTVHGYLLPGGNLNENNSASETEGANRNTESGGSSTSLGRNFNLQSSTLFGIFSLEAPSGSGALPRLTERGTIALSDVIDRGVGYHNRLNEEAECGLRTQGLVLSSNFGLGDNEMATNNTSGTSSSMASPSRFATSSESSTESSIKRSLENDNFDTCAKYEIETPSNSLNLYVATEKGIFEFHLNLSARKLLPSLVPC